MHYNNTLVQFQRTTLRASPLNSRVHCNSLLVCLDGRGPGLLKPGLYGAMLNNM